MPRKKSQASEWGVQEKQQQPLVRRLNELITDPAALREYLSCSPQAINQYRLGTSSPTLEKLCKIADFYNVSWAALMKNQRMLLFRQCVTISD